LPSLIRSVAITLEIEAPGMEHERRDTRQREYNKKPGEEMNLLPG
jgi:hypothetical protein